MARWLEASELSNTDREALIKGWRWEDRAGVSAAESDPELSPRVHAMLRQVA